jgi:hypothetical protein
MPKRSVPSPKSSTTYFQRSAPRQRIPPFDYLPDWLTLIQIAKVFGQENRDILNFLISQVVGLARADVTGGAGTPPRFGQAQK